MRFINWITEGIDMPKDNDERWGKKLSVYKDTTPTSDKMPLTLKEARAQVKRVYDVYAPNSTAPPVIFDALDAYQRHIDDVEGSYLCRVCSSVVLHIEDSGIVFNEGENGVACKDCAEKYYEVDKRFDELEEYRPKTETEAERLEALERYDL